MFSTNFEKVDFFIIGLTDEKLVWENMGVCAKKRHIKIENRSRYLCIEFEFELVFLAIPIHTNYDEKIHSYIGQKPQLCNLIIIY